ncbi:Winged helix-turn-helix protein [Marine Group I thaumarchaeote SCGC RSA3]|uniref:Winged helix-turn-helix protein n=3 Tax=Marine Group I TaxID=905826 RepID=A0A081RMG3_9ARCH|nr:Winged helix-turn-helix protein [Marine Group I thaumarchaeote SCGC AAA799-N04]KFM16664.1 Winged helix-turn-helix protein [Marine Group I thaumarchaeote SCGC AAA799-D11]KFM18716.1 Winged helix-turn-helix protein [Marine Group I thaumarchaeote SCGC RSA3]
MVKKITKKNCKHTVIAKEILRLISEGYNSPSSMYEYLEVSKEKLNYHLKKMISNGLISKYSQGIYDLTEAGKKSNATYVKEDGKKMVQLENMRFKCKIYDGFKKIMEYIRDPKISQLNNGVTQYNGKLKNLSVKVLVSKKSKTLEVTCEKKLGVNRYEIYYKARKQVEDALFRMMKDGKITLGMLEPSMKPEWAIPHPIAEIILDKTESSQIRTKYGVINRSKGRNADWEVDDITQTERVMNMPNDIEKIHQQLGLMMQQYGINEFKEPPNGIYM